jgi:2-dehydropantoate 2-reductase
MDPAEAGGLSGSPGRGGEPAPALWEGALPDDEPVLIWGAGAMGGAIGARLHLAGRRVLLVDVDGAHVQAIASRGLAVTGPVERLRADVPACTPGELEGSASAPFRVVLLAVKAHHTPVALDGLEPHLAADGFVVSVQNGLNERVIAERLGPARTIGCFVNFGADVVEPGVVLRGNRGAVVVGELDGALGDRIRWVHRLFQDFEPDAVLTTNIWGYLWGKLAYGALLFATALTDAPIAEVLSSEPHRPTLIAVAREVMAVAGAEGVHPEPFDGFDPRAFAPDGADRAAVASLDRLVAFNRASAKSHSGVWRDLAVRRRKTEVDAQIAPIARIGSRLGVDTPLVRRLVDLVRDVESGERPQAWETLDALVG